MSTGEEINIIDKTKQHTLHELLAWSDELEQRSQDVNEQCAAQREMLATLYQRCALLIDPQTNSRTSALKNDTTP